MNDVPHLAKVRADLTCTFGTFFLRFKTSSDMIMDGGPLVLLLDAGPQCNGLSAACRISNEIVKPLGRWLSG